MCSDFFLLFHWFTEADTSYSSLSGAVVSKCTLQVEEVQKIIQYTENALRQ